MIAQRPQIRVVFVGAIDIQSESRLLAEHIHEFPVELTVGEEDAVLWVRRLLAPRQPEPERLRRAHCLGREVRLAIWLDQFVVNHVADFGWQASEIEKLGGLCGSALPIVEKQRQRNGNCCGQGPSREGPAGEQPGRRRRRRSQKMGHGSTAVKSGGWIDRAG